ncbi:hypothetical protein ACNKHW_18445 [Shigella flexneri]
MANLDVILMRKDPPF